MAEENEQITNQEAQEENEKEKENQEEAKQDEDQNNEAKSTPLGNENDEAKNVDENAESDINESQEKSDKRDDDKNLEESQLIDSADQQKKLSFEYVEILTDIGKQNQILKGLKERLLQIEQTDLKDTRIRSEILGIRCCLEQEKRKLKCLMQKAMKFQQEHPSGPWDDISIEPSMSEDCFRSGQKNHYVPPCVTVMKQFKEN